MDQPVTALNLFKQGLDHFPGEVTLLTGVARIHEVRYFCKISDRLTEMSGRTNSLSFVLRS